MTYDFTVFKGSSNGEIHEAKTQRPEVTRDEVFVGITHSGVCGTDIHFHWVDMGLGHEGIGIVKAVGPDVKALKIGDRVGWGYVVESCGVCDQCVAGNMVYCLERKEYGRGNTDQGSFGTGAVWKEQYLFKIPENLGSDAAAPLMCAGITVFAPLARNGLKPTDVVGVVGIGGLGHLAIQFAAKMGYEVVALSGTEEKREEATKLGAHHFVATKGVHELQVPRKINHLIVTTSKMPDWNQYESILAPLATIYPLTITDFAAKLEIPFMNFLLLGRRFIGSTVPPKIVYQEMLDFAALHGVKPIIEKFPMTRQGVEDSLKKLDEGKMRYRGVLYAGRCVTQMRILDCQKSLFQIECSTTENEYGFHHRRILVPFEDIIVMWVNIVTARDNFPPQFANLNAVIQLVPPPGSLSAFTIALLHTGEILSGQRLGAWGLHSWGQIPPGTEDGHDHHSRSSDNPT